MIELSMVGYSLLVFAISVYLYTTKLNIPMGWRYEPITNLALLGMWIISLIPVLNVFISTIYFLVIIFLIVIENVDNINEAFNNDSISQWIKTRHKGDKND